MDRDFSSTTRGDETMPASHSPDAARRAAESIAERLHGDPTTIVERIERRARLQPRASAVTLAGRTVTYGELAATARRAAERLRRQGIGRGDFVGVYCRRTPDLVAVILGIWHCGAVYVPLDPKYPSQRLRTILSDAAPKRLIVDGPIDALGDGTPPTLAATELTAPANDALAAVTPPEARLEDRAVVLYTSGSTGLPKGVVLSHANLANHFAYAVRRFRFGPHDRRTSVASINFDISLEEIFATLTAGAELVLPDEGALESFERLLRFIEQARLTAIFLPTSLWRELTNFLHAARREFPESLRLLTVGGERASQTVYQRFLQVGGRRLRWFNLYGPTETTIYSTTFEHHPDRDATAEAPPPIGRPIDNTRAILLDDAGVPVADGEVGELYLGGLGVAEGYLGRPELTAQRFVERPHASLPAGRYYRTGDLARYRADGELEFVGRSDDQIKLRGFRIEPAEIEAVLVRHAAVRDAAITAHAAPDGTGYLAAYIVLHDGATWDAESLRQFVLDHLPEYMLPRAFLQMDALPLSENGKIARRLLPEPFFVAVAGESSTTADDAGGSSLERQVRDLWSETLGTVVGLHDDFIALGGDSLKAMALTANLERALGRPLAATTILQARTVARLLDDLQHDDGGADSDILVTLRDGDVEQAVFFVHALAGDAWIYRELIAQLQTSAALFGLQFPAADGDADALDVETCAAEYVRQVRAVQPAGPYRLVGYSSGGIIAFEMQRQLRAAGETVELLGLIDAAVPPACERRWSVGLRPRIMNFARNATTCLANRREWSLHKLRQTLVAQLRGMFDRRRARRAAVAVEGSRDDDRWLRFFAQDISFFPRERLQRIKRHFDAIHRYEPTASAGSADLFRVARQPMSSVPTATLGWEHLLHGPLAVHGCAGTHDTVMQSPHVASLAAALDAVLQRAHVEREAARCELAAER
jgi:amino acid adenylation domain-containing protein